MSKLIPFVLFTAFFFAIAGGKPVMWCSSPLPKTEQPSTVIPHPPSFW